MTAVATFALGLGLAPAGAEYLAIVPPAVALLAFWVPMVLGILSSMVLPLCAFCEVLLAIPVPGCIYAPIVIAMTAWLWPRERPFLRPKRLVCLGVICSLIGALYFIPWTSRKPFLRDLYAIRPGMTVEEVRKRMAGYMEGTGITMPNTNQEFTVGGALVFRHSNDGAFNADWGIVSFQNGKVVSVQFDPD
jgi:hypothetical protein